MKKNLTKVLLWFVTIFSSLFFIGGVALADDSMDGGNGTNNGTSGCPGYGNKDFNPSGINYSTCFGVSWRWYEMKTRTPQTFRGKFGEQIVTVTVSEKCYDYGGGFYFVGYEAYDNSKQSLGYNVPGATLSTVLSNGAKKYERGSAESWSDVKAAFDKAVTTYPSMAAELGLSWNNNSKLQYFCSSYGEVESSFQGKATVEYNGDKRSTEWSSNTKTSGAINITLPANESGDTVSIDVPFTFGMKVLGNDTSASSGWSATVGNATSTSGDKSGTFKYSDGTNENLATITAHYEVPNGSSLESCGTLTFNNGSEGGQKVTTCVNINIGEKPEERYVALFSGNSRVYANADITGVVNGEDFGYAVGDSNYDSNSGTWTIPSGTDITDWTIKTSGDSASLRYYHKVTRIDSAPNVAIENFMIPTPVTKGLKTISSLNDLTNPTLWTSTLAENVSSTWFDNLLTNSYYDDWMPGTSHETGTSGDFSYTTNETALCQAVVYAPTRLVTEDGTSVWLSDAATGLALLKDMVENAITNADTSGDIFQTLISVFEAIVEWTKENVAQIWGLFKQVIKDLGTELKEFIGLMFSDDGHVTSYACVTMQQAYNFKVEPKVYLTKDYVYAGESISIDKYDSQLISTPYDSSLLLTKTSPLTVQLAHFTVDANVDVDATIPNTDSYVGSDICNYFSGVSDCEKLGSEITTNASDHKSLIVYPEYGEQKAEKQFNDFYDGYDWSIPVSDDAETGRLVCVAAGVKTANSDAYLNGDKDTWSISVSCVPVAKKPSANIINGGAYFNGGASTSTSVRDHNADKVYGSWVQYDIVAKGDVKTLASGSQLVHGIAKSSYDACNTHPLTIANENCGREEAGNAGDGIEASNIYSNVVGTFTKLADTHPTSDSDIDLNTVMTDANYEAGITDTYGVKTSGDVSIYSSMSDGALPSDNGRVGIIYVTGNARITSNLVFNDIDGTEIPQALIIADGDIYINDDVTRIDAWLVAGGNIYTADKNPVDGNSSSDVANEKLTIHGPVFANSIYLNRTGGADPYNYESTAETIDLAPTTYIWLYQWSKKTTTKLFIDTLTELAPRY